MKLKLFLENFDPIVGKVSYSVEDENGDRVARAEYVHDSIKTYNPSTMDFFVLSFIGRLEELNAELQVQGPVSQNCYSIIGDKVKASKIIEGSGRVYTDEALTEFKETFYSSNDLSKTLANVFNYFE